MWVAVNGRSPRAGQAATSSASNRCSAAQAAISSRLRSGMQAVRNPSFMSGTSTQVWPVAESTTAWVRIAARRPSAKVGSPSGCAPATAA